MNTQDVIPSDKMASPSAQKKLHDHHFNVSEVNDYLADLFIIYCLLSAPHYQYQDVCCSYVAEKSDQDLNYS